MVSALPHHRSLHLQSKCLRGFPPSLPPALQGRRHHPHGMGLSKAPTLSGSSAGPGFLRTWGCAKEPVLKETGVQSKLFLFSPTPKLPQIPPLRTGTGMRGERVSQGRLHADSGNSRDPRLPINPIASPLRVLGLSGPK